MKLKTIYICSSCQHQSSKWIGKCPSCNAWNSFIEDVINVGKAEKNLSATARKIGLKEKKPKPLRFKSEEVNRLTTSINEFDNVLGGGFVPSSLTLLTGEPGIGKSTITLQIADNIGKKQKVLIISGEESVNQIGRRAQRLSIDNDNITALNDHQLESILDTIRKEKPGLAIIDSIQVISSIDLPGNAGSVSQVRYCTEQIMELAKSSDTTILLIGHVTKDGNLAGPRALEHLVDTVLQLEGDRFHQFRMLKSAKNRFGSCNEVGIFEMTENGLQEVTNPSEQFLKQRREQAIGSVITATLEGNRPFLVEVQALVSTSHFGYPKRTASGFDLNRLQLLIAVLEKYGKLNLQNQDVYINIVGGLKIAEPAADLAVSMAIASSLLKKPLPNNSLVFGELGLSGEIRRVTQKEKREREAKKMGFEKIISSSAHRDIRDCLRILTAKDA